MAERFLLFFAGVAWFSGLLGAGYMLSQSQDLKETAVGLAVTALFCALPFFGYTLHKLTRR